jgi:hypothetical protein
VDLSIYSTRHTLVPEGRRVIMPPTTWRSLMLESLSTFLSSAGNILTEFFDMWNPMNNAAINILRVKLLEFKLAIFSSVRRMAAAFWQALLVYL